MGKRDRVSGARVLSQTAYLRRSLPALFHTARTLSGSLRSPPSPRGEGFVRRYSFSTYACIRSDDMGIALLSQTTHLRRIFPLIFHTASALSAPSGHLLPKEGGSIHASPFPWKGLPSAARRGWLPQQVEKEWKEAFPRFVIPSAAEGSFSFPVSVFFRNAVCMKHRPSDSLEARCFPLAAILTSFA